MFTWRMEVKDETFTNLRDHPSVGQDYITPDDGVATLDDFSVDGAGNCLEARFRASPKFVDIRARDIVSLEVSEDGGASWTPVYRGYVVTAGNPRSQDVQEYKLNGLRQRLFEVRNTLSRVLNDDVSNQVEDVLNHIVSEGQMPAGINTTIPSIPTFGFANVVEYPNTESYGDTLKRLAEFVGEFVVPSGDTYSFDGITYTAGEKVPGTNFGVDPSGNIIFTRLQTTPVTFKEADEGVAANYTEITGEDVVDTVDLVYFSSVTNTAAGSVVAASILCPNLVNNQIQPIPLVRTFSFGNKNSRVQKTLEEPTLLMSDIGATLKRSSGVTNPSGPISGGVATYGSSYSYIDFNFDLSKSPDGIIIAFQVQKNGSNPTLGVQLEDTLQIGDAVLRYYNFEFDSVSEQNIELPFGNVANANLTNFLGDTYDDCYTAIMENDFRIDGTDIEVSNLRVFVPDVDDGGTKSERFASGFVRNVQPEVAEVRVVNQLGAVAPRMNWTPEGETEVTVPVERIQYTLTPNDGLVTTYELGQAFDAELLSERAVLKGLAREAVSE